MKRLFIIALSILLLVTFLLVGCAKTAPPTTTAPTTAPTAPAKVIELKLAHYEPPQSPSMKAYQEYADKIAEATKGRVKITLFGSSTLLAQQDTVSGVKTGIAEMGHLAVDAYSDQYPLSPILALPLLPLGDWRATNNIWMQLLNKFPEMNNEWKDFKVLFRSARHGMQIHTTKVPVRAPKDIKGIKMFAPGDMGQVMNGLGASALFIPPPDWYTSLERGLMEGMLTTWDGVYEMKLQEHLKYHTSFPSYAAHPLAQVIMNFNTWNSLPPDIQKAFDDLAPWVTDRVGELIEESINSYIDAIKKEGGHEFINLSPSEEKIWVDAALPLHTPIINKIEARGLPAKAIYDEALRLAQQ